LVNSKNTSDQRILALLETPDRENGPKRLLATVLIANNAVNIAIVLISSLLTASWFAAGNYPDPQGLCNRQQYAGGALHGHAA